MVGEGEEAEHLADQRHEAVQARDQQHRLALVAQRGVHDGLVVLDDVGAGELGHVDDEAAEEGAAEVAAREELAVAGFALEVGFEGDLGAHGGVFGGDPGGAAVGVEVVEGLEGGFVAFALDDWKEGC